MKRSILIGAATGILSNSGLAAILINTPSERLPRLLRSPWIARLAAVCAVVEMGANAFVPTLPPRTTPGPLGGRVVMGAGNAALLAHVNGERLVLPVIAGGASAAVAATVATEGRARFATVLPDILFAATEAIVSIALARKAIR